VRIEVFFGSWCPHCREIVPQFLKSIQSIGNHGFEVTLTGVPHPPFDTYAPAREKGIRGVPTFIVYRGDEELGRFSSFSGESSVEHEIVLILTDKKRSS